MKKSYLVEGYRFVIAISIMIFHFLKTWSNTNNLRQGVEFFFVLSGFLLMAHCEKASGVGGETVGKLMVGKLKSVYPETFVVFWMAAIAVTVLEKKEFLDTSISTPASAIIRNQHLSRKSFVAEWNRPALVCDVSDLGNIDSCVAG